ncbi:hypothetical protein H6P81_010341 [Aristolochia fimbriata]|uniref:Uncharacterized protein n=1 Tax=Aristolochia fimbriata TaxID=158543 RepID=A0AAV7ERW3_ARIFI|nr:hypothetical protein H6P81_010341 [Aristolochia fimbriata]
MEASGRVGIGNFMRAKLVDCASQVTVGEYSSQSSVELKPNSLEEFKNMKLIKMPGIFETNFQDDWNSNSITPVSNLLPKTSVQTSVLTQVDTLTCVLTTTDTLDILILKGDSNIESDEEATALLATSKNFGKALQPIAKEIQASGSVQVTATTLT